MEKEKKIAYQAKIQHPIDHNAMAEGDNDDDDDDDKNYSMFHSSFQEQDKQNKIIPYTSLSNYNF